MSREAVQDLMDRWINEAGFRADIRRAPEETLRQSAADLSADEWAAVRKIDWNLSDEQLQERINPMAA